MFLLIVAAFAMAGKTDITTADSVLLRPHVSFGTARRLHVKADACQELHLGEIEVEWDVKSYGGNTSTGCMAVDICWYASAGLPLGTTFLVGDIGSAEDMQMPSAAIVSATCGALTSAGTATMLSGNFLLFMFMLSVAQIAASCFSLK
jgi:hypothetical protein